MFKNHLGNTNSTADNSKISSIFNKNAIHPSYNILSSNLRIPFQIFSQYLIRKNFITIKTH